LATIAAYKTLVVESALEMLTEKLVEDGLRALTGRALSGNFDFGADVISAESQDFPEDFSGPGYDSLAADFMNKYC
jgi:hypothetical protein